MIFMLMPQIAICIIIVCMFSIPVSLYSLGCVCLVGVETVFLAIGLGVLVSGITIRTKLTKVTFLLLSLMEFFAGQVYSIAVFPLPLRIIAYLNPVTYLLDLLRYGIIGSEPLMNLKIEILWSLFCTLLFAIAGILIYRKIIFKLKENGGLTNY